MNSRFDELKNRNLDLALQIDTAERQDNFDLKIKLQKELYTNKLELISLISLDEQRAGITARELKNRVMSRPNIPRYATGIEALDYKLFGGIEVGTFIQLAGESGVGKTHLQLEILSNIAKYNKSVFFNFEIGDVRIVKRLERLITDEVQWDNLIIDNDSRDIDTLCNEIILYARDGVKFFTIDSKMKLNIKGDHQDYQKFSMISKRLAELSQKQEVIIFLINQMNEEDIKNKRLAFKGSGDQKYDADIALFYVKDKDGNRKLICNKNRQDETEFSIDFILDENGRTTTANNNLIPVMHQDKNKRYISSPVITEYKQEKVEMGLIL